MINTGILFLLLLGFSAGGQNITARRLTAPVMSAYSLFAMHAPQECLAGQYCEARSGSSSGTGACPAGSYCGPGSVAPQTAPAGQFVETEGSVRAYDCASGTFAPYAGLPYCLPCPPGYSCVDPGTTTPSLCSAGTYRTSVGEASTSGSNLNVQVSVMNSISCSACPEGTFSPLRGVPDVTSCDPCPAGRICLTKTDNITASDPCSEGYICGDGTTLATSTSHACLNGFVCGKQTTPTSVYQTLCTASFVCKEGTTFADRFRLRCPVGFYCPEGSPWKGIMEYPLQPGLAYFSSGQFYVLQVAGQYCLRQRMVATKSEIDQTNLIRTGAGLPELTEDEQAVMLASWEDYLTTCVQWQIPHLTKVSKNAEAVGILVQQYAQWHASQLLSMLPEKRAYAFSNKCDLDKYPRPDVSTTYNCLCTANITDGSLVSCLTSTSTTANIGSPFSYESSYDISDRRNCNDWPDCIDWARLNEFAASAATQASKTTGPSTGGVLDDFDSLGVPFVDYINAALKRNFMIWANQTQTSVTSCPFGTMSSADGLQRVESCSKRTLLSTVDDPDDLIIFRLNPINRPLSNQAPRSGYPVKNEEDMRLVFSLPARAFATITLDTRDLPSEVEYGMDWRIQVYVGDSLVPEGNDRQICRDIWKAFLEYHYKGGLDSGYTAALRDHKLAINGCSSQHNPLAFQAFSYASGNTCPSTALAAECSFLTLTTAAEKSACSQTVSKINEFYLHALVDVEFRIEIQIVNGQYMPDRFKFIRSVQVDVAEPSRANLGSKDAFVIEISSANAAATHYPYNLPIIPASETLLQTYQGAPSGNVSGTPAVSQAGLITTAYLSWLPRDTKIPLSNCLRHTDGWEEYFYSSGNYFTTSKETLYQTHLPFFSNCRGFGSTIPLWFVLEKHPNCLQVPQNETVPITELSFGGKGHGDMCVVDPAYPQSKPVEIECIVDEIPNNKQPLPRWFEAQTGAELFAISYNPFSGKNYAQLDERSNPLTEKVPVILRAGAMSDGTWLRTVDLSLRYWQASSTQKILTTADVKFSDFSQLSDAQSKGKDSWKYNLRISWSPMTHIEVFNAYAFSFGVYIALAVVVGVLSACIVLAHWAYHRFAAWNQAYAVPLTDRRYWQLMLPPLLQGVGLAIVPITISLFSVVVVFLGETNGFTTPLFSCSAAQATSSVGCQVSILDRIPPSWSGQTTPTPFSDRRKGRAALVLVVLGMYLLMWSMKGYIPNLVSHYYDNEEENDDGERNWPPDQQIFAPLVHKRSSWFLMIAGNSILITLMIEFSYSTLFTNLWYLYVAGLFLVLKVFANIAARIMKEQLLKIPIMAVSEAVIQVLTLGSPDYFSFIITVFITQAIFLIDRLYITPNQPAMARLTTRLLDKLKARLNMIFSGGKLAVTEIHTETEDVGADGFLRSQQMTRAERDQADGMMFFLASYSSNAIAAILTPIMIVLLTLLYDSSQSLNNYNVSVKQAKFYFGFQFAMLFFKFIADLIIFNTAETYHEWKILDYLEYCRYRFTNRPHRWKGVNELADELITPELRSLDLMCFSSQFFFSLFLSATGGVLIVVGMQIAVNLAWNVFDDQASPFIILGGVLLLSLCRNACFITADYLKVWFVKSKRNDASATESVTQDASDGDDINRFENMIDPDAQDKPKVTIEPPVGSALHNWVEPSTGDKSGWERYRLAYLKENQLWLQAHMDNLIDGPTSVEFRKVLMDSLAKVLKESNILDLARNAQGKHAIKGTGLELTALPAHDPTVRQIAQAKVLTRGTAVEYIGRLWLLRARFISFLRDSVASEELEQADLRDYCETCGIGDDAAVLSVEPEYPISYIADQLRIQRDYAESWNMPAWVHFYSTFTPACTMCETCKEFYSKFDVPIPVDELREQVLQAQPMPCAQVLDESPFNLPASPIPLVPGRLLLMWFDWARTLTARKTPPITIVDSLIGPYGYLIGEEPDEMTTPLPRLRSEPEPPEDDEAESDIEDEVFPVIEIDPVTQDLMREWLHRARFGAPQ